MNFKEEWKEFLGTTFAKVLGVVGLVSGAHQVGDAVLLQKLDVGVHCPILGGKSIYRSLSNSMTGIMERWMFIFSQNYIVTSGRTMINIHTGKQDILQLSLIEVSTSRPLSYLWLFSNEEPHVVVLNLGGNGANSRPGHLAAENSVRKKYVIKHLNEWCTNFRWDCPFFHPKLKEGPIR